MFQIAKLVKTVRTTLFSLFNAQFFPRKKHLVCLGSEIPAPMQEWECFTQEFFIDKGETPPIPSLQRALLLNPALRFRSVSTGGGKPVDVDR